MKMVQTMPVRRDRSTWRTGTTILRGFNRETGKMEKQELLDLLVSRRNRAKNAVAPGNRYPNGESFDTAMRLINSNRHHDSEIGFDVWNNDILFSTDVHPAEIELANMCLLDDQCTDFVGLEV